MNATTTNLGIRGRLDGRLRSPCCLVGVLLVGLALVLDPASAPGRQKARPVPCTTRFTVVGFSLHHPGDAEQVQWGKVTPRQRAWWDKRGQRKFPHVCAVADYSGADYIIAWSVGIFTYADTRRVMDWTQVPVVKGGTGRCSAGLGGTINCTFDTRTGTKYAYTFREVPSIGRRVMAVALVVDRRSGGFVYHKYRHAPALNRLDKDVFVGAVKFIARAESAR